MAPRIVRGSIDSLVREIKQKKTPCLVAGKNVLLEAVSVTEALVSNIEFGGYR